MATTIGNLAVVLSANTSRYSSGLRSAGRTTHRFSMSAERSLNRVFSTVTRLGAAGAAVAAGATIVGVAKAFERLDDAAKTSAKLGVATEELSRLQFAGEQTGVGISTLNMALQRMTRRVAEAAMGTGEAKGAIAELGLNAEELKLMGPIRALHEIADAMQAIPSQGDRVRLAMKLFDSEGVSLVNTLAGGSAQLKRFGAESDRLGNTISSKAAKSAEAFNDSVNRLKSSLGGVFVSVAQLVAPSLERLSNRATAVTSAIQSQNTAFAKNIATGAAMAAGLAAGAIVGGKVAIAVGRIVTALRSMAVAQSIVTALSGPKGWAQIAAGLAVAGASAYAVTQTFDALASTADDVSKASGSASTGLADIGLMAQQIEASTLAIGDAVQSVADGSLSDAASATGEWASMMATAKSRAKSIYEATRTPAERLAMQVEELNHLLRLGAVDAETYARALKDAKLGGVGSRQIASLGLRAPRRVSFGALGAAGATGRQTDASLKAARDSAQAEREQLAEQRRIAEMMRDLSIDQGAQVLVSF